MVFTYILQDELTPAPHDPQKIRGIDNGWMDGRMDGHSEHLLRKVRPNEAGQKKCCQA